MTETTVHPEAVVDSADTRPDWKREAREVICPLCGYNLRGLVEPRCPECGYRFEWNELLDPTRALHPYLYEHHPERGIRSFWRTAVAGLRPSRFWSTLSPTQPSNPIRLARYAVNVLVLALLPLLAMLLRYALDALPQPGLWAGSSWPTHWGEGGLFGFYSLSTWLPSVAAAVINMAAGWTYSLPRFVAIFVALVVTWAIGTYAGLMIFQQSMGKAAVQRGHVLRCMIYAIDLALWPGIVLTAMLLVHGALRLDNELYLWGTLVGGVLAVLFFPIGIVRLIIAYRRYLRFDHSIATVLAVQLILALAALLLLCLCHVANFP